MHYTMASLLVTAMVALLLAQGISAADSRPSPIVRVANGTLIGKHVASYNQDLFLGVPFAQPPVGPLRFENPQSLNTTFGARNATEYPPACVGYGVGPKRREIERAPADNRRTRQTGLTRSVKIV
jgi:carboxylesterase family protein